MGNTLISNSLF